MRNCVGLYTVHVHLCKNVSLTRYMMPRKKCQVRAGADQKLDGSATNADNQNAIKPGTFFKKRCTSYDVSEG